MSVSRRTFIQIGGSSLGAATLGSALTTQGWGMDPSQGSDPGTDGEVVIPTMCELCFWKCGVLAHVKDGTVTKLVGNPKHPLSRGRLCPRGTGGTGLLYDPDRLRQPLVRSEARGAQVFRPVSWDDALNETAERLLKVRDEHGPEALALFSHGYGGSWFKTLVKSYGSSTITAPSFAQCRGSREVAFEITYGSPVGSPEATDIAHSRVLTLIGSHLGENMHNTQVQELATAIERGAQLVVVDPRFSVAAGKARYWLPIKPGTDIALLLAWMHVIVKEGLYDRDYVEKYTLGIEELRAHLADKTPEWAWARTTIPAATIVETARFIAGARPASLIHPGRRTAWYGDDTQRGRAIAIMNALLGTWGREGGFYLPTAFPLKGMPKIPFAQAPKAVSDAPEGVVYPFTGELLSHGLRDASIPGDRPAAVKAWMVYGTNLTMSLPQPDRTIEALKALDFVVAIDVLPAEITGWADVVLPEATYLERHDDLAAPPFREPYVAIRQPVVPPMYESKPGWWIAKELGKRMGVAEHFPFDDAKEVLIERCRLSDVDWETLQRDGVVEGAKEPITIEQGVEPTFDTPSGKIEIYSAQLAEAGLSPLPDYTPPEEPAADQFRLLFGRAPTHTFGRTTNNRLLGQILDENPLWVNARRGEELGLTEGEEVTMVNGDGVRSQPIHVHLTQRIRPDCVYTVHGFGHDSRGLGFARNRGASDTKMMTKTKIDPAMGGTGMNVNFIRIERAIS